MDASERLDFKKAFLPDSMVGARAIAGFHRGHPELMTAEPTDTRWIGIARAKLHRICGAERGEALLRQALVEAGLTDLRSPDDLAKIADVLVKKEGFVQAVGFALQFQATLHGARPR